MPESSEKIVLIYDGECPFCERYSDYISLRRTREIALRDAREHPDLVNELRSRGYDLNKGMALLWGDDVYLGRSAMSVLDTLTMTRGAWDASLRHFLRIPGMLYVVYPICRLFRWIALKLLGKDPDLHPRS